MASEAFTALLNDPILLEAAWRRVVRWYQAGEWAPQPEFAEWELNHSALLADLGARLATGSYTPGPMSLLPYPKAKGRLRHFSRPLVMDQVAFTAIGLLLAPVLESAMYPFSFGNRWYRRVGKSAQKSNGPWEFLPWSMADENHYQPYRRAHGLFRRVASWTVNAMLKSTASLPAQESEFARPEDYSLGLIPEFARESFWTQQGPAERIYWARFDLRLAFPSVKLDVLAERLRAMIGRRPRARETGIVNAFEEIFQRGRLEDSLRLYRKELRQQVLNRGTMADLADYLVRMLREVRYRPFPQADKVFFGRKRKNEPPLLPKKGGAFHPGLPTGLALSPLLLNAYLHPLDEAMQSWMDGERKRRPAAFLRFVDDMILLASSREVLAEGIEAISAALGTEDLRDTDVNLRLNWEKVQPPVISTALASYRKCKPPRIGFAQWLEAEGQGLAQAMERAAVTAESRNPFVNDLVERMSELGTPQERDILPAKAQLRITRLQELVVFSPDASVVPRETQLVFAANQLVGSWLPEEQPSHDERLLHEIRRAIAEALRGAPEKPKLWRSVWRAALRRPIRAKEGDRARHDRAALAWLKDLAKEYSLTSDGAWVLPFAEKAPDSWELIWPLYSSFQRAAFWRAAAKLTKELAAAAVVEISEASWIFRAFDEKALQYATDWLGTTAASAIQWFYGDSEAGLPEWESEALALALAAFTPHDEFISHFGRRAMNFVSFRQLISQVAQGREGWRQGAAILAASSVAGLRRRSSLATLGLLCARSPEIDRRAAQHFAQLPSGPAQLLNVAEKLHWERYLGRELRAAAEAELGTTGEAVRTARREGTANLRLLVLQYQRARRIWLGTQGSLE